MEQEQLQYTTLVQRALSRDSRELRDDELCCGAWVRSWREREVPVRTASVG
jgi:hypothetical protein